MPENIEIDVFLKKPFPLDSMLNELNKLECKTSIKEITVMDNWNYDNTIDIPLQQVSNSVLMTFIDSGKIALLRGQLNGHPCGCHIERQSDGLFRQSAWVAADILPLLKDGHIDGQNTGAYRSLANDLITLGHGLGIQLIGVGVETFIQKMSSIQDTISNSSGVLMWLIPNDTKAACPAGYIALAMGRYSVFLCKAI